MLRDTKQCGEQVPIRLQKRTDWEGKNGKAGGSGQKSTEGRETGLFSHPSIPPLQPEEACASVTPQDGNTKKQ